MSEAPKTIACVVIKKRGNFNFKSKLHKCGDPLSVPVDVFERYEGSWLADAETLEADTEPAAVEPPPRCKGKTKAGKRCKRGVHDDSGYCSAHAEQRGKSAPGVDAGEEE